MGAVRCFLCGGRVSNGVCTECGMPQRKRSEEYNLNNSPCDAGPMTHVHDHGTEDRRRESASEQRIRLKPCCPRNSSNRCMCYYYREYRWTCGK